MIVISQKNSRLSRLHFKISGYFPVPLVHMNAPHLAAYLEATEGAVAEFTLHEMTKIA